jgi:hypothetical protein
MTVAARAARRINTQEEWLMAITTPVSANKGSGKRPKAQAERPAAPAGEEEIRVLAYQLYERRRADGVGGDAVSDWAEAERRLRRE